MTVSAAAAFAMMTAAFAFAMMTATLTFTVMTAAATALTAASQVLDQVLYLLVGSLAVFLDLTCEVQSFASQRVVGVHRDAVGLYLHHLRHDDRNPHLRRDVRSRHSPHNRQSGA